MREIKFAQNLKQLRIAKNITQAKLAAILGVDQRTISAWEKGICEPSLSTIAKLCEILDESLEGLIF